MRETVSLRLLQRAAELGRARDWAGVIEICEEIVERSGHDDSQRAVVIEAMRQLALAQHEARRPDLEARILEDIVVRAAHDELPRAKEIVNWARLRHREMGARRAWDWDKPKHEPHARGLDEGERRDLDAKRRPTDADVRTPDDADEVWPELILLREKYGFDEVRNVGSQPIIGATRTPAPVQPASRETTRRLAEWADSQLMRANMLWQREGKRTEAINTYRSILHRIKQFDELDELQLLIARAMNGLAGQLAAAGEIGAAIDVNNALVDRFDQSPVAEVRDRVISAQVALDRLGPRGNS